MKNGSKNQHRGFVMTGGGAKGLYEAGVIHAFHLTGMEFDVITGSSIGAMNSIFYAEYLFCKSQLPAEVKLDPLQAVAKMDDLVKAFHHAWLTMPDKQIINDSEEGPLGMLKEDLLRFNLTLPQVASILWWWTEPDRNKLPPPKLWPSVLHVFLELVERVGALEFLRIVKDQLKDRWKKQSEDHQKDFWKDLRRELWRTYLTRFNLEHSLVPDNEDRKIKEVFTSPISPLREDHLSGSLYSPDKKGAPLYQLVDPDRTLRDYANAGINVRLTRANYRTGRLEMSSYVMPKEFACFLEKHAWRVDSFGPEKIPLGSFRLKVPGNPLALHAAICSGRFPGVFRPYRLEDIYRRADDDNKLLYGLLDGWLGAGEVESNIKPIYKSLNPGRGDREQEWAKWKASPTMRAFFPGRKDTYVDGGSIDNTPYTAAVDFVRDSLQLNGGTVREEMLELYVIYLETEPSVQYDEEADPLISEVVSRTLALVSAAGEKGRANTFETINSFGNRAEQIARILGIVLESYKEALKELDADKRRDVEEKLLKQAQELWRRDFSKVTSDGILDKVSQWAEESFINRLPLQVETVKIYPEKMPLDTLQFTERLGYKKDNALQMLAMGCYNTLDSLRTRLDARAKTEGEENLNSHDQRALMLVRKWTGDLWQAPAQRDTSVPARPVWQCQWTGCVFHANACPHGAKAGISPP